MNCIRSWFFKTHVQKNMTLGADIASNYPEFYRTTLDGVFYYHKDGKMRYISYSQPHRWFIRKINDI